MASQTFVQQRCVLALRSEWKTYLSVQGDKNAADQAAVDMMRKVLATVQMDGVVVIGEGEKDVSFFCLLQF